MLSPGKIRAVYDLHGVVQGVGFRPTLYRMAQAAGLCGWIQNRSGSVRLALEGPEEAVDRFVAALPATLPAPARIETFTLLAREPLPADTASQGFSILESRSHSLADITIPADLAICSHCRQEMLQPGNRRHGYAFTTCTVCGPRYTVLNSLPYDRRHTSLAAFPLCPACQKEYDDPADRRFRGETIACPACGPRLSLQTVSGVAVPGNPLIETRRLLAEGQIVAVRGIGGFLLAADAFNRETLKELRARKQRPHKPLAVMARNMAAITSCCRVPDSAGALLSSPESPIVILDLCRPAPTGVLVLPVDLLSPDTHTLGMMLPYSPLHLLLFEPRAGDPTPAFRFLVMTSGNRRSEPICITDEEACDRLAGIADFMLTHNREITLRNDDSVAIIGNGKAQIWRRARGYAPSPIRLATPLTHCVLAMGAEVKNTVALGYDRSVVLSPHIGDLETPEALEHMESAAAALPLFLNRTPDRIAVDLHPDMHSTRLGRKLAQSFSLPVRSVQHHQAHAAACLAESGYTEGLALVLDGHGLGPDGTVWGAELLWIQGVEFKRLATFEPVPLPGGDAAVRHPVRQLIARWVNAGLPVSESWMQRLGVTPAEVALWTQQCRCGVNTPLTHAAGRVFDAFAALLGFADGGITYEAQAAIRLETAACEWQGAIPHLPVTAREQDSLLRINWQPAFLQLAESPPSPGRVAPWAAAVHHAVARACVEMVESGLSKVPSRRVALSGGVFMNRLLNNLLVPKLESLGLEVLEHRRTPPNDGCIALGQAVVAGRGE